MTRSEIKAQAKEIIKTNKWNIWKPYLCLVAIIFGIELLCEMCGLSDESIELVNCLVSIATIPVSFGIMAYTLKIARGEEFSLNMLKEYYPMFGRLFLIQLLTAVFVILWSILFIIPGIIAAIGYSMVVYIATDYPELTPKEVLNKSKEIMNGHKFEYFVFGLSFIGWEIVSIFTFGLLYIWLMPYMVISNALYYDQLDK